MTAPATDLRYPVGKFVLPDHVTEPQRHEWIANIAATPQNLRQAVHGLNPSQLDTPYRDGGWTVRQVAHHLPDSHLNAYIRLKLALTEDAPTIKPYDEAAWAGLEDSRSVPVETSLTLLESVHARLVVLLKAMGPEDFARKLIHPEHGERNLDWLCGLYSWHGRHHVAHITGLRQRMGW